MTNLSHGIKAEVFASEYLVRKGFVIIDQNWKTKWCEIDIVARINDTIYFVEVKYRLNDTYGSGLDFITPSKLKQMSRAAEGWVLYNNWTSNYQLAAIEVSGEKYQITGFLKDL